jgi:hypothetical protein
VRPRREALLLALVAVVALSPVYPQDAQDAAHLCLSEALVHGRLTADSCLSDSVDRSRHGAHLYSDKAPGLALIAVPAFSVLGREAPPERWPAFDLRLWGIRVLSVGLCFVLCAFMVGRVSEGLAPGYGGAALVAFALGTLVEPFAATEFDHVPAAMFAFAAFLLAWRGRPFLAGLAGGLAVLTNFESGLAIVIVGVYLALRGLRPLGRYGLGILPGAVLLAAYDWGAFGAPWRLPYRYLDNVYYSTSQKSGFFGIGSPHVFQSVEVLAGPGGLLVVSPVLALACVGLFLLRREHPAEAAVCGAVTVGFVLLDCGYFVPYGGLSPGPRFLIPALPFLAVGLAPVFRRVPLITSVAAVFSVISMTAVTLVWSSNVVLRRTVWGELVRIPSRLGSSRFAENLTEGVLLAAGPGRVWGAAVVALVALAALVVGIGSLPWREIGKRRPRPSRTPVVVGIAIAYLVAAAQVSAAFEYPYGNRTAGTAIVISPVGTSISAQPWETRVGGAVEVAVKVAYEGNEVANDLVLSLRLSRGLQLEGPPSYLIGSGCAGTQLVVCNLDYLPAFHSTMVTFVVRPIAGGWQSISAWSTSGGHPGFNHPRLVIPVAS